MNEYKEIVAKDTPTTSKKYFHCMDLIPGASLPKKSPYRLTPIENEELNRQVYELLHKGLTKESLSPCAMPIVLAPKNNGEWRM